MFNIKSDIESIGLVSLIFGVMSFIGGILLIFEGKILFSIFVILASLYLTTIYFGIKKEYFIFYYLSLNFYVFNLVVSLVLIIQLMRTIAGRINPAHTLILYIVSVILYLYFIWIVITIVKNKHHFYKELGIMNI